MSRASRLLTAILFAGCASAPAPGPPAVRALPGPASEVQETESDPVTVSPPTAPPFAIPAAPEAPPAGIPPPAPDPVAAADRELAAQVERALATDPALRDAVIEATVERGQVTLTGTVPTFRERARAIEAALGVPGVRSVRPRLGLQSP